MSYVDGNEDADAAVLLPRVHAVVPFLGRVVPDNERALWQLLEEAFRGRTVDVEVQRLGG